MLFSAQDLEERGKKAKEGLISPILSKADISLLAALPNFKQGYSYPYVTVGYWSTHDLIKHLLRTTGPAHLYAATWSISEDAAIVLAQLLEAKVLLTASIIVDPRVKITSPTFVPITHGRFSHVYLKECHAKCFVLFNKTWKVSCVCSANFTNNPRIEAGHISTNTEIFDFHYDWLKREIAQLHPFK